MRIPTPAASLVLALALSASGATAASAQANVQYINGNSAADPDASPFSGAVLVDNTTLYLSGVLGRGDTAEDAARQALNSIRSTLEAADMTMDDLVSVQVFATDLADYAGFNTVYRSYFTSDYPARAFLGAGSLLANARFEVLGVAVRR